MSYTHHDRLTELDASFLDLESPALALIFGRMRTEVDSLAQTLSGRGFRVEALHGGMSQDQRDRMMRKVRGGTVD